MHPNPNFSARRFGARAFDQGQHFGATGLGNRDRAHGVDTIQGSRCPGNSSCSCPTPGHSVPQLARTAISDRGAAVANSNHMGTTRFGVLVALMFASDAACIASASLAPPLPGSV